MASYEPYMIKYESAEMTPVYPKLAPGERIHIPIDQDESIVHTNEYRHRVWMLKGEQPLRRKGNGRAIHISDFICGPVGCLQLTDDTLATHEQLPLDSPLRLPQTDARKIIYPGKNHNKWWDIQQLM
jgi:hypothetical protein